MGACCFKPVVSEDAVEVTPGAPRASRGAARSGASDAPGPGNRRLCRKAPVWTAEQPMTRGQLLSKRDEFWDTAPAFNGRPEIWQALRAAAECEDTETAQAIMSAVDVTLPQGNLSVVYDELGNKYDIPAYCLSEPNNLVKTDGDTPPTATSAGATEDAGRPGAPEAAAVEVDLRVKLRLSTNREVEWAGPPSTNVAALKKFIQEKESVGPERQRFLFGGQLLPDSQTLAGARVPADSVVQIMVREIS